MAAQSHPRLRCNKNIRFNFTTNLNTDLKLNEEIDHSRQLHSRFTLKDHLKEGGND